MHATASHNGGPLDDPAGYGLKFVARDRDKYFDDSWTEIVLALDGGGDVVIPLGASFWRSSTELRSADIGKWLLHNEVAPWPKGGPPGVIVTPDVDNRFTARILRRRNLR
jgi:hypothetical protein